MNRMLVGIGALGMAAVFWGARSEPARAADTPPAPSSKPQETVQQLLLDLRQAKGLAAGIDDKIVRMRMEQVIAKMEKRCEELQKQVAAAGSPAVRTPVADADFAKFLKALQANAFDDAKGAALRDYVKSNYFTCAQAATLVKQFSFGDGQRGAAIALHPRLTDPGNFFEVLAVITFDADRKKVREALGMK